MSKVYKYTITVYSASPVAGNMLLDSLTGGDEFADNYEREECDETDLPAGSVLYKGRIISEEYAAEYKARDEQKKT
jgi:hypothetical protein